MRENDNFVEVECEAREEGTKRGVEKTRQSRNDEIEDHAENSV